VSLQQDWFLLPFEIKLQAAHARALEAAGILTPREREQINACLEQLQRDFGGAACPQSDAEDLHTWIETQLVDLVGEAGKKIHTARSRNDQVATLLVLYVIEAGRRLEQNLARFVRVCASRALDWSDYVFPLQTHAQFAAPGSLGCWILRFAVTLERIRRHAIYFVDQWKLYCPLGSGAVAGSSIPIDRRIQATELGFAHPSPNALASTGTRDECLEYLFLAAQVALHLQSLAADVIAFSQTPFGWTIYPRGFGTGSSMMPNKRNPDAMELLRGECCSILAAPQEALFLLKGLPSGYNRDLQTIKPFVHRTVEKLDELVSMATAFLEALDFDPDRLKESLGLGDIDATLRMEQLVMQGMPLREAHGAVAKQIGGGAMSTSSDGKLNAGAYQTVGCASPAETRRVAAEILSHLRDGTR
jgi:argininosuccinate lyase